MTAVLPDLDTLVREALTAALPDASVFTLWPDDWASRLPLVVARRVAGAADDPRFLDRGLMDVTTCAADRGAASLLARRARAALWDACTAQFASAAAGGYLSRFADEFEGPAELRTGNDALLHANVFRFQATYSIQARPARTA